LNDANPSAQTQALEPGLRNSNAVPVKFEGGVDRATTSMAHVAALPMQTSGQLHLFGCDEASPLREFWSKMGASMGTTDQEKCRAVFAVLDVEYLIKTVGAMMNLEANCFEAILLRQPTPRGAWLNTIEYYVGRPFRRMPSHVPASAPLALSVRSSQEIKPRHPEDEKLGTFLARTGQFAQVKLDVSEIFELLEMQEREPGNPIKLGAKQWKLHHNVTSLVTKLVTNNWGSNALLA
jgi:hypothetical protein